MNKRIWIVYMCFLLLSKKGRARVCLQGSDLDPDPWTHSKRGFSLPRKSLRYSVAGVASRVASSPLSSATPPHPPTPIYLLVSSGIQTMVLLSV